MAATTSGQSTVPRPRPNFKQTPTAKTGDFTVLATAAAGTGLIYTNAGAIGTVVFTLPTAESMAGSVIGFKALAAQDIECLPVTLEKIYLFGDGVASKKLVVAGAIGNYAELYSDGVSWTVEEVNGVVTKEA